jgi:non-heme chloroperoxidase
MANSAPVPAVFVHGLWMHATSWDNWTGLFNENGYQAIGPGWPGESDTAQGCRDNPGPIANRGIAEVTDHYAAVIAGLPSPPIVIGHSFGGLIAERLLGMGLARGGVVIAPAQFRGVHRLPLVQLETAWPVLGHPGKKSQAVPLTQDQFAHGFANCHAGHVLLRDPAHRPRPPVGRRLQGTVRAGSPAAAEGGGCRPCRTPGALERDDRPYR